MIYGYVAISYAYNSEFSRDVMFANYQNPAVLLLKIICHQPLYFICIVMVLVKKFIFMDDKLPTKTAKITSVPQKLVHI